MLLFAPVELAVLMLRSMTDRQQAAKMSLVAEKCNVVAAVLSEVPFSI